MLLEAGMEARGWMLEAGKHRLLLCAFTQDVASSIQDLNSPNSLNSLNFLKGSVFSFHRFSNLESRIFTNFHAKNPKKPVAQAMLLY